MRQETRILQAVEADHYRRTPGVKVYKLGEGEHEAAMGILDMY
jgi:hypothetical protein